MPNDKTTALLVEDEEDYAEVLKELLGQVARPPIGLVWANGLAEAQARLRERTFDVALMDLSVGDSDGLNTLQRLRALAPRQMPIVVLTGQDDEETALQALREGAEDYLVKTRVNAEVVARAVRYAIERKRFESERENLIVELREALDKIQTLRGLLPICSACKKVRDDKGYWSQIETFIQRHSGAEFTHSLCPDCLKTLYPQIAERRKGPPPEA